MALPVRVNEENYSALQQEADREHRSATAQLNLILQQRYLHQGTPAVITPLPKNTDVSDLVREPLVARGLESSTMGAEKIASEPSGSGAGRDMGDVLADIRSLEADRDEELRFNQDPGDNNKIRERYAKQIQPLWDEYHSMKEPTDGLLR